MLSESKLSHRIIDQDLDWLVEDGVKDHYSPDQPRDAEGQWSETGEDGGGKGAARELSGMTTSQIRDKADELFQPPGSKGQQYSVIETNALQEYAEWGYADINEGLRSNPPRVSKEAQTVISAFSKSELKESVVVHRGMITDRFHGRDLVGAIIEDKGILSTSLLSGFAKAMAGAKLKGLQKVNAERIVFRIEVQKGTPAIFMGERLSESPDEVEVLFSPGRKIVVTGEEKVGGLRVLTTRMVV